MYLDAANPKSYVSGSTIWSDLSNVGNNGVLMNGPSFSSENGGSIVFDGNNDYGVIYSPTFMPVGTSDFTVSVWVKLNSLPFTNPRICCQSIDSNNYFNLGTYGGSSPGTYDTFWFEIKKSGIFYCGNFNQSIKYTTGVWYNLVGTFNNTTNNVGFYINNVIRIGAGVNGIEPSPTNSLIIGNNNTASPTNDPLPGNIASISMYNRVLTYSEILQNYNTTKTRFGL